MKYQMRAPHEFTPTCKKNGAKLNFAQAAEVKKRATEMQAVRREIKMLNNARIGEKFDISETLIRRVIGGYRESRKLDSEDYDMILELVAERERLIQREAEIQASFKSDFGIGVPMAIRIYRGLNWQELAA